MNIDWFTIAAQAINFLILVGLMKHFLYKPILNAIDTREKRLAAVIADANAKEAAAKKELNEYQQKNEALDRQRDILMSQMAEEVKSEHQRLLDEARKATDDFSAKQQEILRDDIYKKKQTFSVKLREEVFSIARKTLADLGTPNLEKCLVGEFINHLRDIDSNTKEALVHDYKTSSAPAILRSAFDLPEEQRIIILNALKEIFSPEIQVQFETAPDLISGIELTVNGQKISWNIGHYLISMEKEADKLMDIGENGN
jgi:F-type H+-transporting ATPase subunit b